MLIFHLIQALYVYTLISMYASEIIEDKELRPIMNSGNWVD